jgi:hypothetical protein
VQLLQFVDVAPGQTCTFTAWLRGSPGMHVNLSLAGYNPPFNVYGFTAAWLTGEWQKFSAASTVNGNGQAYLT